MTQVLSQNMGAPWTDLDAQIKTTCKIQRSTDWSWHGLGFCGCCGSRYSPSKAEGYSFFNRINQGIQMMVNPDMNQILEKGDEAYSPNQKFKLVELKIGDVNLLFKLSTFKGQKPLPK